MSPPSFIHTRASPDDSGFLSLAEYILVFVTGCCSPIHNSILSVVFYGSSVSVAIRTDILEFHLRQLVIVPQFQGLHLNDALVIVILSSETRRDYRGSKETSKEGGGITDGPLVAKHCGTDQAVCWHIVMVSQQVLVLQSFGLFAANCMS